MLFESQSTNVVPGVGGQHLYVLDVPSGIVVQADSSTTGVSGNGVSFGSMSRNGRYVAFDTSATNLDPRDADTGHDIYVKDIESGVLRLASTTAAGAKANQTFAGMSAVANDGVTVAFFANATDLAPGVSSRSCDDGMGQLYNCTATELYLKDLATGTVAILSNAADGTDAVGGTVPPRFTADGTALAVSVLDQLVPGDVDGGRQDVYLIDLATGTNTLVSTALPAGTPDSGQALAYFPDVSADGRRVAFEAVYMTQTANFQTQVFVKDLPSDTLRTLSVDASGTLGDGNSQHASISPDGGFVSFSTNTTNLPGTGEGDSSSDAVLVDLSQPRGTFEVLSADSTGLTAGGNTFDARLSAGATTVVFSVRTSYFDPRDTDPYYNDLYLRRLGGAVNPDADADGVDDVLQPAGTALGAFIDAEGTTGYIRSVPTGFTVKVSDAAAPDGVRIETSGSGIGRAELVVCGFTVRLGAGADVVLTCGSVTARVASGPVEIVAGDGRVAVAVPASTTARVDNGPDGSVTVQVLAAPPGGGAQVTVAGVTSTVPAGQTSSFVLYAFDGFRQPIDNPPVVNKAKAGSAIPVKFSLGGDRGLAIFAAGSPGSVSVTCGSGDPVSVIDETTTSGSSSLGYDAATDLYHYAWKTGRAWAGTCRQLVLELADGSVQRATFDFRK